MDLFLPLFIFLLEIDELVFRVKEMDFFAEGSLEARILGTLPHRDEFAERNPFTFDGADENFHFEDRVHQVFRHFFAIRAVRSLRMEEDIAHP